MEVFTIGRLATEAGVNVETIRYYERRGLLLNPPRTAGGYRQYSRVDLRRLQFIARAKRLGFTLAETVVLLGSGDGNAADNVLLLARDKLRMLDERQRELAMTRLRLELLIDMCEDPSGEDCEALRVTG